MDRPITTLYMLMSVDGRISTGASDGSSLMSREELSGLGVLKLESCTVLEDSYIRLRYQVIS